MGKHDEKLKRFATRVKAETAIESFFSQIYTNSDLGGAKEWLHNDTLTLFLEELEIVCYKHLNLFKIGDTEFRYNFMSVNLLCHTLLLDEG